MYWTLAMRSEENFPRVPMSPIFPKSESAATRLFGLSRASTTDIDYSEVGWFSLGYVDGDGSDGVFGVSDNE
jgi:hypothetical protein